MSDFDHMPGNSRIWIYQAPRKLEETEQQNIKAELESFVNNWESHGSKVNASYTILYDLFVILSVDETSTIASGCSIDKSVHIIEKIAQNLNVDFFNRMNIAYINDGEIVIDTLKGFKKLISEGLINKDTIVFDNTITSKHQMVEGWKVKAQDSWLKQYFIARVII